MTVGYPDYARLSQQGAEQLYFASASSPPENSILFQGYVGAWPYVNLQTRMNVSSDIASFLMYYYSDSTFANLVAFRKATRGGSSEATTQYANLSPWLFFFYVTQSGLAMPVQTLSLYATTAPGDQFQLSSNEDPMLANSAHIAASTLQTFPIGPIQPGNGQFSFSTGAASWYVNFQYYSYGGNNWFTAWQATSSTYTTKSFVIDMPMTDEPWRVQVNNGDATSQNFIFSWVSKLWPSLTLD